MSTSVGSLGLAFIHPTLLSPLQFQSVPLGVHVTASASPSLDLNIELLTRAFHSRRSWVTSDSDLESAASA